MEKKKVLLIAANSLSKGGIQNVIFNIVKGLSDEFQFDVVSFYDSPDEYNLESFGCNIYKIPCYSGKNRFRSKLDFYIRGAYLKRETIKIIKEHGPYIAVHSHKMVESAPFVSAAKKCGVPVRIAHAHTAFAVHYHPLAKLYVSCLKRTIDKNATDRVACSKKAGEELFGDKPFEIVYNTVDEKFLRAAKRSVVNDSPVLLQVGAFSDNKNQLFSAQVLAELKKKYSGARLTFIGVPKDFEMMDHFEKVKKFCEESGISESVSFITANGDVLSEMQKSDYVIFPSRAEGFGIVPIEAQAQGMRCFVSSSVPADVDCGGCIFLDLNDGAAAWAEKISETFEKDHGAREKYDMTKFLPETISEQYKKLYNGEK